MTEFDLQKHLYRYLRRKGLRPVLEVPLNGRSIDLAYITSRDLLVAWEVKLRDWKGGYTQAGDHLLACDYAVVVMPTHPSQAARRHYRDTPVGLGWYDGDELRLVSHPGGPYPELVYRQQVTEYIEHFWREGRRP